MKVIGKSKEGHRILLVTEHEYEVIKNALFEYKYLCDQEGCSPDYRRKLTTVYNRFDKSELDFEKLKVIDEKKLIK